MHFPKRNRHSSQQFTIIDNSRFKEDEKVDVYCLTIIVYSMNNRIYVEIQLI